ncbi:hypothetical protein OV079_02465 [Nannocystis pusilla]|uniref:Uncharacterized protein n=1 Tax=Nannocystis pusilla TaxID=889268 RepID=A0A9X3EJN3_9BACT|nr:hypothetical protein [Nannocystis pusilla]MCY1004449.1 hypothetical protein [Nannocystis pusilla]
MGQHASRSTPALHADGGSRSNPGLGTSVRGHRLPRVAIRRLGSQWQRQRRSEERDSSRRAYENHKDGNPGLRYGEKAADFGSGGLFGALAPYFLWTGAPEVRGKAPLLNAPPELVFQPRAAAFGAAVYLQRLLKAHRIDDIPDIKVGWANPSLLGSGRGGAEYHRVRGNFLSDATQLNVDLTDASTIPETRRVRLARRPRRLRRPRRRPPQGVHMTIDIQCYGEDIKGLADLVGDFDLRSPMDVHAWYRVEWQAIAELLGFSQELEATLAPMRAVRDRVAATQQAGLDAFARWLRRQRPSISEPHARTQDSVLAQLLAAGQARGELWRVSADPTALAAGACYDDGDQLRRAFYPDTAPGYFGDGWSGPPPRAESACGWTTPLVLHLGTFPWVYSSRIDGLPPVRAGSQPRPHPR